jgi:hypothetical protein
MPYEKRKIIVAIFNSLLYLSVFRDKQARVSTKADAVGEGFT